MPRLAPDHVGQRIVHAASVQAEPDGDHPVEMAFFYLVKTGRTDLLDVEEAVALHARPHQRHVVQAAILGKADDALLAREIDLPETVARAFRHLFFDRGVFRHALDAADYVETVPDAHRDVYKTALQQGADVLLAKHHIGPRAPIDPKEVIRQMLAAFYERSQAHRGQELASEVARAALQWGRAAVDTAATLIDKGSNQAEAALKDLRLTLEVKDHTITAEAIGVRVEEIAGRE